MPSEATSPPPYWRRDQQKGITPPDLEKSVTYADHIVRARGKRSQFTSVSKEANRISRFGDQLYELEQIKLSGDGHALVVHEQLMDALRDQARNGEKADRAKAVQALRYAKKNREGLVDWRFEFQGVESKARFEWAAERVRGYFSRR